MMSVHSFIPLLLVLLIASAVPALAVTGKIVDTEQTPIADAEICYLAAGGATLLCAQTDEDGRYELPDSEQDRIRVTATDHVYRVLPVEELPESIVLLRAARVLVRLTDAETGERIGDGRVWVVSASGRRHGPLPCRAAGVRVRSLAPGPAEVFAGAEGYVQSEPTPVTLEAGGESEVVLELQPQG